MSLYIAERRLRLYRTLVHPLLSILIPLLFLLSLDQLLRVLLPRVQLFPTHLWLPLLFAGVEETVMGNLLYKERASFVARIRELCVLAALVFAYVFVLLGVRSGGTFALSPILIYPMVMVMTQWIASGSFHAGLREREILLSALSGKSETELRHALRDSSYQAGVAIRVLRGIKTAVVVFQILVFAVLTGVALSHGRPSGMGVLAVALHSMGGLAAIGLLNSFVEEQMLQGSGILVPLGLERKRFLFSLCMVTVSAAMVMLAARNASLLPLSALIALLRRLTSLFHFPEGRGLTQTLQRVLIERQRSYDAMLPPSAPPAVNPLALLITELLRRLFRTLIGTGAFLFVVFPLLSQEFLDRMRRLKPLAALIHKLHGLLLFCAHTWLRLMHWLHHSRRIDLRAQQTGEREKTETGARRSSSPRISMHKRVQMNRVLRAFATLLNWGKSMGIPHQRFDTPQEYTAKLAAAFPVHDGGLIFVAEVFEEAVFSLHLIDSDRISRYLRTIRMLRRSKEVGRYS